MRYPNPDILVYIGMADAYAAACEYIKLPRDANVLSECLAFRWYLANPVHTHFAGLYTDDTEMSAANAQVLIECDPPYTPRMFADAYVREFIRGGKRKGYARSFQGLLESVRTGEELLQKLRPDSTKNGAAMRGVPFGVLRSVSEVMDAATIQARITHDTPEGRFSARAVALMSHFSLYEELPLSDMASYVLLLLPEEDQRNYARILSNPWPDGKSVRHSPDLPVSIATVQAAATIVASGTSLMDMLERVLRIGGDTDSVAAIVWGIASPRFQSEVIPDFLERDLEHGSSHTGVPYLRQIGAALMKRFV